MTYEAERTCGKTLQALAKLGLLKGAKTCKLKFCEYCIIGKKSKIKLDTAIHRIEGIIHFVHTNVWGPAKTTSLGDMHYFVSFIDDFSRCYWVYTMGHK